MTYEQNVKTILESNFAGFKEEIIDIACQRICELADNPCYRALEIISDIQTDIQSQLTIAVDSEANRTWQLLEKIKEKIRGEQ